MVLWVVNIHSFHGLNCVVISLGGRFSSFPKIKIWKWNPVPKRPSISEVWRCVGFSCSPSYHTDNEWLVMLEAAYERQSIQLIFFGNTKQISCRVRGEQWESMCNKRFTVHLPQCLPQNYRLKAFGIIRDISINVSFQSEINFMWESLTLNFMVSFLYTHRMF